MLAWLRSLFVRAPRAARPTAVRARSRTADEREAPTAPAQAPRAALPGAKPTLALDHERTHESSLAEREQALLARLGQRIEQGQLELPQLPSTSLSAIDLCARPHVEIRELVALIERDPMLSSELLRLANSVLYAASEPAQTLNEAVLRVGLRTLRSMLYSVSVRGAILREGNLSAYAHEVWRQASSSAAIARALAGPLRMDKERAYLIGLLHDVGKLPLLAMLRKEVGKESEVTPALVGRAFRLHHEAAGAALARAWKLPEELAEVAGNHHRFETNLGHGEAAALASLAHKFDLFLSMQSDEELRALVHAREMEFLAVDEPRRHALLARAQEAFELQQAEAAAH